MSLRPYKITVEPAIEPVTVSDVKAQLQIETDADDSILSALITSAREYVENETKRKLIEQTVQFTLCDFPYSDTIYIPSSPLVSVESITYYDTDAVEQTLSADTYTVRDIESPPQIVLLPSESWPSTDSETIDAVTVTVKVGYGDAAADVPETLKQAIILKVRKMYDLESSDGTYLDTAIKALLNQRQAWWA